MKKHRRSLIPLITLLIFAFAVILNSAIARIQDEEQPETQRGAENSVFAEENEQCFRCHGEEYFTLVDTIFGREKKQNMCEDYQLERDEFYKSVHWSFSCLDCHSEEYTTFPHALELRFADYWTCLDCHGYDENFAQYHFEEIQVEYEESVHYTATEGEFSCWNCHDPHSYQVMSRTAESMSEIITETNNMCLECHGNEEKFRLLSERELGNIVPEHDWLPNQNLHFQAVRCIECHSEMNDSLLISHDILKAEKAVKNCVECHSENSILMGTLYKFRAVEEREEEGFINGVIINNEAYVIGANRSRFLNILSLVIFALTLGAIAVHTLLRIKFKKK